MAAGRPIKPTSSPSKRTPKVAGRGGARVTVSKATEAADTTASSDESTAVIEQSRSVSGVERKRRAAAARDDRERAANQVAAGGAPPRDTGATYRTAAVIGAVALVIGMIAAIMAFHPGADVTDNRAFVDQTETEQVLSQARSAACAPFQFDYQNLDKWTGTVRKQYTGEARKQFDNFLEVQRKAITDSKTASECDVDKFGVETLEGDHASVIGTVIIRASVSGEVRDARVQAMRYGMDREDGTWRVSSTEVL